MENYGADLEIWRIASARGKALFPVPIQPRLAVNSASAAADSAVEGHGVARVMPYRAAAAVKAN